MKLLVTVFSSAVHGLEERAFVVTQECRVFLAKRFCFGHVYCVLPIAGMVEEVWAPRTDSAEKFTEKRSGSRV